MHKFVHWTPQPRASLRSQKVVIRSHYNKPPFLRTSIVRRSHHNRPPSCWQTLCTDHITACCTSRDTQTTHATSQQRAQTEVEALPLHAQHLKSCDLTKNRRVVAQKYSSSRITVAMAAANIRSCTNTHPHTLHSIACAHFKLPQCVHHPP